MQEAAVCLEVDDSSRLEEAAVAFQEHRAAQTAVLALELGVGESEPDLGNLARCEEGIDEFYSGPQEGDIRQPLLSGCLGALPQARALDVDSDVVGRRGTAREVDRVLSLAASKFQDNRSRRGEHLRIPLALYRMIPEDQPPGRIGRFVKD